MGSIQTKFINEQKLPLVIEANKSLTFEEFLDYIRKNKDALENKILKFGGLLFRGFPIIGADGFNAVVDALGFGKPISYIGGDTPRDKVKGKVYTSTEAPPSFMIPLHNEMSFVKYYPRHIYFYCEVPAQEGGETSIADARGIYNAIHPKIKEKFAQSGLKYISNFYGHSRILDLVNRYQRAHKTWMDAFETDDKKEVEKRCYENEFGYKWTKKDWLQVIHESPSVIVHPKTGERAWFNQAHLYDYNPRLLGFWNWLGTKFIYFRKDTIMHEIFYGDGTPVTKKDLYQIMDVLEKETIRFPWQKHDMMVLDNILTMHGRAPYAGKRRILAAMTR
ncbi:MAG TPA: TauD/TfdA family dioxygenase [Waddliaceae bacterium]